MHILTAELIIYLTLPPPLINIGTFFLPKNRYIMMKSGTVWAKGSIPLVIDCQHIQFADYTAAQVIL